jgi:hypothetical protein
MTCEQVMIWKGQLKILHWHLHGELERNEKPQSHRHLKKIIF